MSRIIPDSSWYKNKSSEGKAPCSCPYANVYKCNRYYSSVSMLGVAQIITSIRNDRKEVLDAFWSNSELLPIIDEEETSIDGEVGRWTSFSNFCPEVSFKYFHYYASYLGRYVDEIDSDSGRRIAEREGTPNDWRYEWGFMSPCHFLDCAVYNQVHIFNSKATGGDRLLSLPNDQVTVRQLFIKEITVGDHYNITGQVGAVGRNAKAEGNTFNQLLQQTASNIDLPALAAELETLRISMRKHATEIEHDQAVVCIGAAEISAKNQDGAGALEHLKSAGKWAFDVATKIGTAVAAKAIQTAIEL